MNNDFQISDDFILPLFDEIFVVKERDFSIEYHPLGMGKQKLLMLVSSDSEEFLEISQLQLLNTIVDKGLRRSMDDIWVVNIKRFKNSDWETIWEYFQPAQVIIWGCTDWLNKQKLELSLHKQAYINGAEVLVASDLSVYLADQAAKLKLWSAMQRMFFN